MSNISPSFHFYPRGLAKESQRVVEKYKDADRVSLQLIKNKLPKLLKQIEKLQSNYQTLAAFAKGVKKIDVNILASEYPYKRDDQEFLNKVITILSVRYNRIVGKRFWDHFQLLPKDVQIQTMLQSAFQKEEENYLALKTHIRKQYNSIFERKQVLDEMSTSIGENHKDIDEAFKEWKVREGSKLATYLWTLILYKYIKYEWFIEKQSVKTIEAKLENMKMNNYKKIIVRYLEAYDFQHYHEELLQQVIERLGDPRETLARWEDISDEVIQKVHKWLYKADLFEFLDGERFDYWKKYIRNIKDLHVIQDPPVAAMYFDQFVVLEFANTGNAAYFYKIEEFKKFILPRMRTRVPENDLKDRNTNVCIQYLYHTRSGGVPTWYKKFDDYLTHYFNGDFDYKRNT